MLHSRLGRWFYAPVDTSSSHRADIQALRALAVGCVLVNHVWPTRLSGGYVGVDVFFVISGFLITGHLLRELRQSGSIRLGQFYARRVRRLLPAALLVLAVSAVLVAVFLPFSRWIRNAEELVSSAFYFENWFLAARSVNYSALNDAASVSQHYWSLSVEEQFYLLWPLFLLILWRWSRRHSSSSKVPLRVPALGMLLVVMSAFALCVWWTWTHPSPAYFVTPVRFWEFGLGGLLALLGTVVNPKDHLNSGINICVQLLSVVGFAAVTWSAFSYSSTTSFPGWRAAVPALGTALVIGAGLWTRSLWHGSLTSLRPIQYLGDISYSVYLWHWPLVVVAPFALGHTLGRTDKIAVAMLAVILAGFTKKFVEDPCRRSHWLKPLRRTFTSMVAGMLVVSLISAVLVFDQKMIQHNQSTGKSEAELGLCLGPNALANRTACPDAFSRAKYPIVSEAQNAYYTEPSDPRCHKVRRTPDKDDITCDFSSGDPSAPKVLLLGDSHAQQWEYGLFPLAEQRHWIFTMTYLGACPTADVAYVGYRGDIATDQKKDECESWRNAVRDIAAKDGTEIVIISFFAREERVDDGSGRDQMAQYADGLISYVRPLTEAGIDIYILGDPPLNSSVRDPDCISFNERDPIKCAVPRPIAQPPDPLLFAARASGGAMTGIDLTDRFCDADQCYVVIGGVPVYYDLDHLNRRYVELLAPDIGDHIRTR